jgi:hypothetical protein
MRDHVGFVVDVTGYIVVDAWKLAGRPGRTLRPRLGGTPELIELAL